MSSLQKRNVWAWAFLAPTLAIFLVVGLYPLVQTFLTSLTNARLGSTRAPEFVGLDNYATLLRDREFWVVVLRTVLFTIVSVALEFALGLVIAMIVHSPFRGRGLMRTAMLVPWAIPTVVSARIWSYMLQDTYGVANDLLATRLGVLDSKVAWLAEPALAFACVVAVEVWKTTPFVALLLLAGLQLIPDEIHEAAEVDGASRAQRFRLLTLPMLKPAILVALIFRTLDALRIFDAVWVMTRGQAGTEMMATYNYRQMIDFQQLGFGSAVSVAIFLLIAVFVVVYVTMLRTERG